MQAGGPWPSALLTSWRYVLPGGMTNSSRTPPEPSIIFTLSGTLPLCLQSGGTSSGVSDGCVSGGGGRPGWGLVCGVANG